MKKEERDGGSAFPSRARRLTSHAKGDHLPGADLRG
nr:MAG TPA: hypothetical protein [Caudoviricetes sp.]